MSDWTVTLELVDDDSKKFWRARVDGKTLYVNYGRIGTNGQTQVKDLASPDAARKEYDKLVAEKRRKGYADAGASGAASDDDEDAADDEEDDAPAPRGRPARPAAASVAAPAAPAPTPASAIRPGSGHRMTLESGPRRVEALLHLDGDTVRMDAAERFANPDAAKQAFERLKQLLASEGYRG